MGCDRLLSQDGADFQLGTVNIDLIFTATTAGAVPSSLTMAAGITSVTKSTNDYIVLFDDSYVKFINAYGFVIQAIPSVGGAVEAKVTAASVEDATPTVTLSFFDDEAVAVPLLIDDEVHFTFRMQRIEGSSAG